MAAAILKNIIRANGSMVASLVALEGGPARFFVVQKRESNDLFVGRVAAWVKAQDAERLEMQPPEVLMDGSDVGEVLMRVMHQLGIKGQDGASEYEAKNVELVLRPGESN